jgi:hypothetical protein
VALCANADGSDKIKPFVIGKYLNPRCFKNVHRNNLGVTYDASTKAWMTGVLFQRWLREFDMKMAGRKTILLIDNAPSHISNLNLRNTTICPLPPNTTSRIQPMDAGIIMSFKCHYRSYFVKWLLQRYESEMENNKMDVLTAIRFIARAWCEVSPQTIRNCFRHTGILPLLANNNNRDDSVGNNDGVGDLMRELQTDIGALHLRNEMDIDEFINYSEEKNTNDPLTDQEIMDLIICEDNGGEEEEKGEEEDEDDSIEWRKITHKEVQNALELIMQYLVQQDLDNTIKLKYDKALLGLHREVKRLQDASFEQVSITTFLK